MIVEDEAMGVAVYPRLGELLQAQNLTLADLERQIERLYGLTVDSKALDHLMQAAPIQRTDLEIVGAVAAVLNVGLDDLFTVEAAPISSPEEPILDPEQSHRWAELLDEQDRRDLSAAEQSELDTLLTEYSRRLHERTLPEIARQRDISVEQARREVRTELDEAIRWWQEFEAGPSRRRALAAELRRRRARPTRTAG